MSPVSFGHFVVYWGLCLGRNKHGKFAGDSAGGAAWYISKMFPYEDTRYDLGGLEHFARPPESRREWVQ